MCHILDLLLGVAGEEKCLGLMRKLCRQYYQHYPKVISEYVFLYKEMYEDDEDEDDK